MHTIVDRGISGCVIDDRVAGLWDADEEVCIGVKAQIEEERDGGVECVHNADIRC